VLEFREPREDETETLTALTLASKAMWIYPEAWLALWRPSLTITVEQIRTWHFELAESGEGNNIIGYFNMPTETKNALRDGWLYTGDIATMDEDGYFYIVDRKKELIKPGGFQVWPREVEEVITDHPKVFEVGVAGIPDPKRGETVKAWVVLQPGETLTSDEVRAWCKERMAAYKVPTQVEFRTELPKTTVGKILRRELVREHKETNGSPQ